MRQKHSIKIKMQKQKQKQNQKINLSDIYNWRVMYVNTNKCTMTKCGESVSKKEQQQHRSESFTRKIVLSLLYMCWIYVCTLYIDAILTPPIFASDGIQWRINVNKIVWPGAFWHLHKLIWKYCHCDLVGDFTQPPPDVIRSRDAIQCIIGRFVIQHIVP